MDKNIIEVREILSNLVALVEEEWPDNYYEEEDEEDDVYDSIPYNVLRCPLCGLMESHSFDCPVQQAKDWLKKQDASQSDD